MIDVLGDTVCLEAFWCLKPCNLMRLIPINAHFWKCTLQLGQSKRFLLWNLNPIKGSLWRELYKMMDIDEEARRCLKVKEIAVLLKERQSQSEKLKARKAQGSAEGEGSSGQKTGEADHINTLFADVKTEGRFGLESGSVNDGKIWRKDDT